MKKLVTMTIATTLSMFLLTACGSNVQTAEDSISGGVELTLSGHHSNKSIQKAIIKVGEEHGWKITEFKSNAVVAEKIDGDDSASATVTFDNDKVIVRDDTGDINAGDFLEDLNDELSKEDAEH